MFYIIARILLTPIALVVPAALIYNLLGRGVIAGILTVVVFVATLLWLDPTKKLED